MKKLAIILTLLLSATYVIPKPFFSLSQPQLQINFVYTPSAFPPSLSFCNPFCPFILIGDNVNFTTIASGGIPPYNYAWNFGDGSPVVNTASNTTFHAYSTANTYTVMLTVTDSASQANSMSRQVVVQTWPVIGRGWVVHWNITQNDGINIWNVTYRGTTVIRDVRLPGVQVIYPSNLCGNFGGPVGAYYDEPGPPAYPPTEQHVKVDGDIFYENSTDPLNPWFQIRAEYRVGGYLYQEVFRFYSTGRWDVEQIIGRLGCAFDHIYEPHWRFNLVTGDDSHSFMSTYTPTGAWQDLTWEGNYTDNGFRDPAHNSAQWRFGNEGRYYYLAPTVVRADLDLPPLASNMILVREHPGEIEPPGFLGHPGSGIVNPVEYVNGELAFRNNISFWFIPRIWDHGPVSTVPSKDITLSFYPYGAWL